MKPLDPSAANYVTRHTSPDGRTVLDLVMVLEPEDFRELGGEQRARIYDAASGETVLSLLNRSGQVTSFEWSPEGDLLLTMENGTTLCVSLAQRIYSLSTEGWRPHRLADIQSNAPEHLGVADRVPPPEPEPPVRESMLRKIGYGLVAVAILVLFVFSLFDGSGPRHNHIPRGLFRGTHL